MGVFYSAGFSVFALSLATASFNLSISTASRDMPPAMTSSQRTISDLFTDGILDPSRLEALPVSPEEMPQGWMTPLELQVLYNVAKLGTGDFLEIGTWIGRSTVAIALGFRDSVQSGRRLDVNDFGFVTLADASAALRVGLEHFPENIARSILTPGGSMAVLLENLRVRGLAGQITSVIRGNIVDVPIRSEYGVVFCDAVHDEVEISVAGPVLSRVLKPGSWLICDDIEDKDDLIHALERYLKFAFFVKLSRFGPEHKAAIGRIAG